MFKVNNKDNRTIDFNGVVLVFIVNFGHVSHLLKFLSLTLGM